MAKTREERLAAAIARCADSFGAVTPEAVLNAAQNPKHPSYDVLRDEGDFDWDDKSAAQTQRLDHARKLIREVRYVFNEGNQHTYQIKAYVRDGSTKPSRYRPIRDVEVDIELAKSALLDGLVRIENAIASMRNISLVARQDFFVQQFKTMIKDVERMRGGVNLLTAPPKRKRK